jgi:cysteinyl-tRNA synthetase
MAALGCLPPTATPRATEHMAGMIATIEKLLTKGRAYQTEGHVLFDVAAFGDYGRLSGRSTEDLVAGARVEVRPTSAIRWTSSCGSRPRPVSRPGPAPGGKGVPGGTWSARP